jgi:hypothetical protein
LYVPYESRLGQHLQLKTERLIDHREHVDEWVMLDLAAHLATKLAALLDRPDSTPGDKDRQEIMALLALEVDPTEAVRVVHDASARTPDEVDQHLTEAFHYLGDMTLDQAQRRWLSRLAVEWSAASREIMEAQAPNRDTQRPRPPTREPPGPTLDR